MFGKIPYEITQQDKNVINAYNKALDDRVLTEAKLNELLKGSSKETATYIRGLNGAKASQDGLRAATEATGLATKVTSGAMKALSIAGSMVATMLISWAIQAAISGIYHLAHASEEAKERLDEFAQKVKESRDALKEQSDFINSDEVKEWEKLSKGVDAYGNSIYLSAEEMDRYHSISNKIADMFPDMVKGWDDQGNAIFDNVNLLKQLNDEYEKSQDDFHQEIVQNSGEKIKDYKAFSDDGIYNGNKNKIDALQKFIDDGFVLPDMQKEVIEGVSDELQSVPHILGKLKLDEIDDKEIADSVDKQRAVLAYFQTLKNDQTARFAAIKQILLSQAYFTKKDLEKEGNGLSEVSSQIVDNFINSINWENDGDKSYDELNTMVNTLITSLKDNPNLSLTLDDFVKLDKTSLTEADYQQAVQGLLDKLKEFGLSDETILQIKLAFNIDDVGSDERDNLFKEVLNKLGFDGEFAAKAFKEGLKTGEINLILRLSAEGKLDGLKFETFTEFKNWLDAYNTALQVNESVGESGNKLKNSINSIGKAWENYRLISGAVNGVTYLTNEQMLKLIKALPDLKEKLKYTTKGWTLESSAMDVVENAVTSLQKSYAEAQEAMTSEAAQQMLQRYGITQQDLSNISSIAEAYALLASKTKGGIKFKVDSEGYVDTESLTEEQKALLNIAMTQVHIKKANEALEKSLKLGNDSAENKEEKARKEHAKRVREAEESLAKKERDIKEKQVNADFEYRITKTTESLKKYANAIEILNKAYNGVYEKDYVSKLENINNRYRVQVEYTSKLKSELDNLISTVPETSNSWEKLASAVEDVSSKYFESTRQLIEYRTNIVKATADAQKYVSELAGAAAEEADNNTKRIQNVLERGSSIGGLFNTSLSPLVSKSAVDREKEENAKLEEEQKRYQQAINKIKAKATDEAKAYDDKQRKTELDEAKRDYDEAIKDSQTTLEEALNEATRMALDDIELVGDTLVNEGKIKYSELLKYFEDNPIEPKIKWDTSAFSNNSSSTNSNNGSSVKGSEIVAEAQKYLGTPYVWGGTSPSGFDCSGLVQYVLSSKGVENFPRKASDQYAYGQVHGMFISKDNLRPGDLVYFVGQGSKNAPEHAGIYIGNGMFEHAPKTGDVVKYSDMTSGYYADTYVGAIRPYAKGTQDFPVVGKKPNGVVGENYKQETLINKKTGVTSIVDSPTLIDTNEYDIIGEKQTSEILGNQYRKGTPTTDSTILSLVKKASKETGVPAQYILAVMDKENSSEWLRTKNKDGTYSNGVADGGGGRKSYGYMAINSINFAGMDKAKANAIMTDPYSNILYGAQILANHYKNTGGNWEKALARYNGSGSAAAAYGKDAYALANSSSFLNAAKALDSALVEGSYLVSSSITESFKSAKQDYIDTINSKLSSNEQLSYDTNDFTESELKTIAEVVSKMSSTEKLSLDNLNDIVKWEENLDSLLNIIDKNFEKATLERQTQYRNSLAELNAIYTKQGDVISGKYNEWVSLYAGTKDGIEKLSAITLEGYKLSNDYQKDTYEISSKYYVDLLDILRADREDAQRLYDSAITASEQQKAIDAISSIDSQMSKIDNSIHSLNENERSRIAQEMSQIQRRVTGEYGIGTSYLEKDAEALKKQLENSSNIFEQSLLRNSLISNYEQQAIRYAEGQNQFHSKLMEVENDSLYKDYASRYSLDELFDANNEFNDLYYDILATIASTNAEDSERFQTLAKAAQDAKKGYDEFGEKRRELNESIEDLSKEDKLANVDLYIQTRERVQEAVEFQKSINDALTDIQQSHYDFIDTLREEQNAIDAELAANKHLSEWLSEDTRKQLFNDEDYAEETAEISKLNAEAEEKRLKFQQQISNLREDEQWKLEGITAEYNKQMDALKDQLSIAKQKLQTVKDQAAIENAMRERDTQIIIGNRVQNVADPDKLYDLEKTAQQSRLALLNEKTKSDEAAEIRDMQRVSDDLSTISSNISYIKDVITNLPDAAKEKLATIIPTTEELEAWLHSIDRDSLYSIIKDDLTESAYLNLDMSKIQGWDSIYDHSEGAEKIAQYIADGVIEDTALARRWIYGNLQNHDNKALTDPYNYGYDKYGVGEWIGTGREVLDTYPISMEEYLAERERIESEVKEAFVQAYLDEYNRQHAPTVISGEGDVEYVQPNAKELPDGTIITGNGEADVEYPHTIETTNGITISGEGGIVINGKALTPYDWTNMPKLDLSALAMPTYDMFMGGNLADLVKAAGEINNDYSKNFHIDRLEVVNPMNADDVINGLLNQTDAIAPITNNQH